jgi:hypothetical protein
MHATNQVVGMAGDDLDDFEHSEIEEWLGRYFTAHADRASISQGSNGSLDISFHSQKVTDSFVHGFFPASRFVGFWDRTEITFFQKRFFSVKSISTP